MELTPSGADEDRQSYGPGLAHVIHATRNLLSYLK